MNPEGPFFIKWYELSAHPSDKCGTVSESRLNLLSDMATEIWILVRDLNPCKQWYERMVYYKAQGYDDEDALYRSLTSPDWEWITEHIKGEHCNKLMKDVIRRGRPGVYERLFIKKWYDEHFVKRLKEVYQYNSNWIEGLARGNYRDFFGQLNSEDNRSSSKKVPLCEWPREALEGLRSWHPATAAAIENVKEGS
jgi:hypothetical protein